MNLYLLLITVCVGTICDTWTDDWDLTWDDCIHAASVYYGEGTPSCVFDRYED